MNPASCAVLQRRFPLRSSDSREASTKSSPRAPTTQAVGPILCPGMSENRDTVSALVNAVSDAEARMRCNCASAVCCWSLAAETEMATNGSPVKAPAAPPLVMKKSCTLSGTITILPGLPVISADAGIQLLGGQGERAITLLV